MKKKYKGYFKKPNNTLNGVRSKNIVTKVFNFTEKPRIGLLANIYLKYINKL